MVSEVLFKKKINIDNNQFSFPLTGTVVVTFPTAVDCSVVASGDLPSVCLLLMICALLPSINKFSYIKLNFV